MLDFKKKLDTFCAIFIRQPLCISFRVGGMGGSPFALVCRRLSDKKHWILRLFGLCELRKWAKWQTVGRCLSCCRCSCTYSYTVIPFYLLKMGWFSGDRGGITLSLYYTTIACYSTNNCKLKFNVKRLVGPPSCLAEALYFVKHSVWFQDVYFSPSQIVCSQSEGGVWWVPLATLKSRLASKKWSA